MLLPLLSGDCSAVPFVLPARVLAKKIPRDPGDSVCRKSEICLRSRLLKYIFLHGFPGEKNTSNRTSVRIVGIADNECAQCGCSAEKPL